MMPLPILLALGGIGLYILLSPAAPWAPSQLAPSAAPPAPTPSPPVSNDAEPPFVPGFQGTQATAGWYYQRYG